MSNLSRSVWFAVLLSGAALAADNPAANTQPQARGTFRFAAKAVRFDVSPALRNMAVIPPPDEFADFFGGLMVDPDGIEKPTFGKQDTDRSVQTWNASPLLIPAPLTSFNVGTGTANPPDPVGDVGPNHYVRMSNSSFQVFSKTGTSMFGPASINTLWAGFGGACETENAGDPVILYDQLADRWLLTQFTSAGPAFFSCVALSTTADPTGTYFRWAFPTASFPDYPKYGMWPNAYLISTREVNNGVIGAYALERAQMIVGNPTPLVVSFGVQQTPSTDEFTGDGLLPADLDGTTPPPVGSPAYYLGSMDDGGPYGASQDALLLWKFDINFAVPSSSSFVLASTIPISAYDTIYPCAAANARSCIPQPPPLAAVDILSYRQRPMFRAAYRNYGSYESIVTNQSVEAAPALAGIRWWEVRSPNSAPVLVQDSTYAPGVTDGIHRWMGSIAEDRAGNMALGYSASSTTIFPSVRYTGRLESDPLGTMAQGEGELIAGTGGRSGTASSTLRWGDYNSMTVDPVDDCTFWYINEYFVVTGTAWTLRAGSFKFPSCSLPSFGIVAFPLSQEVCTPNNATFTVQAHGYNSFSGSAALGVTGNPAGTTVNFAPASIASVPGNSTLTIGNTGAVAAGSYALTVTGTGGSPSTPHDRALSLNVFTTAPPGPALTTPANAAGGVPINPTLSWSTAVQGKTYVAEVATDAAFTNIVFTSPASTQTSVKLPPVLINNTTYFWRVRSTNVCGTGTASATFSFVTRPLPGSCPANTGLEARFQDNMENGVNGWTTDPPTGTTWTQSTARPFSGTTAWLAVDVVTASDQRLISPTINLPVGQAPLLLRFEHDVSMEPNGGSACFDGGFVEVSTDNGANWTALAADKVQEDFFDGPLATGNSAWCGIQPYTQTSLDIDAYAGQSVKFRFRAITDTSVGNVPHGWYVDDVKVVGCSDRFFGDGFE